MFGLIYYERRCTYEIRCAIISQIVALSITQTELMALASYYYKNVWMRKLALGLGFPQLKFIDVHRTTLVASLLLTTCTFVVAVSTLLREYAVFRN